MRLPAGAAVLAGAALAWSPAFAATRRQKELQRIQEQLERKKREAQEFQRLQAQTQQALTTLLDEKQRTQRLLLELKDKKRDATARESQFSEWLGSLKSSRDLQHRALAQEVLLYARQINTRDPFHGGADLWRESFQRAAVRERARLLGGLQRTEDRTATLRDQARKEGRRLRERASKTEAEMSRQDTLYQQKQVLYAEAGQKAAQTLREVQELEESARALSSLIEGLERRRAAQARGESAPISPHSLPWPVDGKVISGFGRTRVPELDTWTIQNGVKIAALPGSAVRPVQGGRVIFTGPFRSYGNVVIIEHDGGFYAVYGQLERILAKKGDRVSPQAQIAALAAPQGRQAVLYFEIRRGQSALDPTALLRKR